MEFIAKESTDVVKKPHSMPRYAEDESTARSISGSFCSNVKFETGIEQNLHVKIAVVNNSL